MVLLNGKYVEEDTIDPEKHKYLGMFRKPFWSPNGGYIQCPCGMTLQTMDQCHNHWGQGHFDTPQYVDIKEGE